jgi:hypothetical protein
MRPGVDSVAHFDQQGDVGAGPETGIQAKDGSYGRRIARILMLETLLAFLQPGFLRLHQGKRILLALDLLSQVRHGLHLAGLLPLSRLDLLSSLSELTMRSFRPLPVRVVREQSRQPRCGHLPAFSASRQLSLSVCQISPALRQPLCSLAALYA